MNVVETTKISISLSEQELILLQDMFIEYLNNKDGDMSFEPSKYNLIDEMHDTISKYLDTKSAARLSSTSIF